MKVNLVFDYSNMAFRSLFIIGKVGLRDNYASQKDINRYITKLATDISYIVRTYVPESRVIMAMDAKGPWRKELLKNEPIGYKGTREKDETIEWGNIFEALDEFAEILEKNNMSVMKVPHAEGDDLIAMYKEHFFNNTKDESIIIVSADKDIRQLVDFKPDTKQFSMVLNPVNTYKQKNKKLYLTQELMDYYKSPVTNAEKQDDFLFSMFGNSAVTTDNNIRELLSTMETKKNIEFEIVDPNEVILHKIFCGDDSDNIPSLYGFFNKKDKWTRITPSKYKKIVEIMGLNNSKDLIANKDSLIDVVETVMKSRPPQNLTDKLMRQQRLVELDSNLFPSEIVEEFNNRVLDELNESTFEVYTYKNMSNKKLLEGTKFEEGFSTSTTNSMFADIDKYLKS